MDVNHDLIHRLTIVLTPEEATKILDDFNRKYEPSLPTKILVAKLAEIGKRND